MRSARPTPGLGPGSLDAALDRRLVELTAALGSRGPGPTPIQLRRLEVRGFAGIGPSVALELAAGPGLTLVLGPTGAGKSSLVGACERLLLDGPAAYPGHLHTATLPRVRGLFSLADGRRFALVREWFAADAEAEELVLDGDPVPSPADDDLEAGLEPDPELGARALALWNALRDPLHGPVLAGLDPIELELGDRRHPAAALMSTRERDAVRTCVRLAWALGPSPRGFQLLDEPLVAGEPAELDRLARVLARVAEGARLVVFTADLRLAPATRRLGVAAELIELVRRPDRHGLDVIGPRNR